MTGQAGYEKWGQFKFCNSGSECARKECSPPLKDGEKGEKNLFAQKSDFCDAVRSLIGPKCGIRFLSAYVIA